MYSCRWKTWFRPPVVGGFCRAVCMIAQPGMGKQCSRRSKYRQKKHYTQHGVGVPHPPWGTANPIRLLPLGGSCRRKATEGAVRRGGVPVRVGRCRWEIAYRPQRLANTPTISQATPASFLPRWGKKPLAWLSALGTPTPKGSLVQRNRPAKPPPHNSIPIRAEVALPCLHNLPPKNHQQE